MKFSLHLRAQTPVAHDNRSKTGALASCLHRHSMLNKTPTPKRPTPAPKRVVRTRAVRSAHQAGQAALLESAHPKTVAGTQGASGKVLPSTVPKRPNGPALAVLEHDHGSEPTASHTLDRDTFGKRVRAARKAFGLTLMQVAEASGISATTISRAERGQLALSYEKFSALARALQMDLAAMFSETGDTTARLEAPLITRDGEGVSYRGIAFDYQFLSTQASGKQMSPILGTIHARRIDGPQDFARHEGEEWIYLLSGTCEVHFEDGRMVELSKGDTLYFDSRIGHAYISTSRAPARTIGACTSESGAMKVARQRTPERRE